MTLEFPDQKLERLVALTAAVRPAVLFLPALRRPVDFAFLNRIGNGWMISTERSRTRGIQ